MIKVTVTIRWSRSHGHGHGLWDIILASELLESTVNIPWPWPWPWLWYCPANEGHVRGDFYAFYAAFYAFAESMRSQSLCVLCVLSWVLSAVVGYLPAIGGPWWRHGNLAVAQSGMSAYRSESDCFKKEETIWTNAARTVPRSDDNTASYGQGHGHGHLVSEYYFEYHTIPTDKVKLQSSSTRRPLPDCWSIT
jgi:hypothetical protein